MRNLSTALGALVVILACVSGKLWSDLRSARQQVDELKAQMVSGTTAAPAPVQVQPVPAPAPPVMPAPTVANTAPPPVVKIPEPRPAPALVKPGTAVATSLPDLVLPSGATEEVRRAGALAQADQVASGRVLAWRERLASSGQTLTAVQLTALVTAATTELRRETEDSLALDSTTGPMDADGTARLREATINRQNDTNLRILDAATPQLTPDLVKAMRTMFETGHAARLAAARADRERAANGGN